LVNSKSARTDRALLSGARHVARKLQRAQIFLAADAGASAAVAWPPWGF
jgi:hypothetical protein